MIHEKLVKRHEIILFLLKLSQGTGNGPQGIVPCCVFQVPLAGGADVEGLLASSALPGTVPAMER